MLEGKKTLYAIIGLQTIILVFAVLIGHSLGKSQAARDNTNYSNQIDMIFDAMRHIRDKYKEENVDTKELIYGAIRGMTEALNEKYNDPYSQFMPPEIYEETMDDTTGKYGGLGMEIGITIVNDYKRLAVISTFEGGPAHKAGLEAGDHIMRINGETTFGISLEKARHKLRGDPGTKIALTVIKESEDEPINIVITRGLIEAPTVKSRLLGSNIGYIKISQFSDTTPKAVDEALNNFEKAKVKGIILDLRGNPGGTLSAAVDVASDFLREGQLVVYTEGRKEEERKEFRVPKGAPHPWHPLVILVDEWSASGSEIVVGAIKDHKRGLIVGNEYPTFGKGSVQTIFPMRDGRSGLKLTVAHYYTPSEKNINEKGIEPDVKYPGRTLPERETYRKLLNSKSLDEFAKEAGDDILRRLGMIKKNGAENPDKDLFDSFVDKLANENIVLSENLVKLAIAQKTKDEVDEYEYDPVIRFAINHLRAFEVLNIVSDK